MRPWVILSVALLACGAHAAPSPRDDACDTCTFVVDILHNLWGTDTMEDCIEDLIVNICEGLHIEDNFICKIIVSAFKEEVLWVIGQIIIEPQELCGLFVQDCGHFVNPLASSWNLTIAGGKPTHQTPPPIQFKKPTLKVLHLSDLHIDRKYTIGEEAQCTEPQCCRALSDPDEIRKPKDVKQAAGKWGTVGNCDAPYWLFTDMLDHIAAANKDIDYIVVSGDLESHADWDYTRERHQEMIKNTSDTIRNKFPTIPVFFAVGNHEGVPIDSFAPHFTPEKFHMDWLYGTMAESWKGWVPDDQVSTVWYNGCFMRKLYPGLRIISLNNGLGDQVNFFLYVNQTDPDGTLTWFQNQLVDAEKAGDKVHIVAHIPGGSGEALEGWAINFYRIVNRFEDTIVAQFFGHTHSEEYNVYYENPYDAKSRPTGVTWSAPSLTPYSEYWPAYRLYQIEGNYSGSLYRVVDWSEYYLNLDEANAKADVPTNWQTLYASVLDEYGLNDASAVEWSRLIDRMVTDNKLFGKYRKNFYRRDPGTSCDAECKKGFLCSARQNHHDDILCDGLPSVGERRKSLYNRTPKAFVDKIPSKEEILQRARAILAKKQNKDDDKCKL